MKKTLLLSILFLFTGLLSFAQMTITINVCDANAQSVRITGPWWGWNPVGGPEAADNGDGTWTVTFPDGLTENLEYTLVVDGFMENLVPAGDFSCAPINGPTYANRLWEVGSGNVSGITYGTCGSCSTLVTYGCTSSSALNYNSGATQDDGSCIYGADLPITFEGSSYEFEGWEGADVEIVDNPSKSGINTSNKVFKVVRNAVQAWAGSTIVTKPIDFFEDSIFKMKVYSPKANIPVTVKFESAAGSTGEFVVNTTKANQWEELTVNFGDEQPTDVLYNLVVIFNNGTLGDGSANSTYYLDDVRFDSQEIDNSTPVSDEVNVTFQVDMTGLEVHEDGVYLAGGEQFGQDGHLMTDQGNNIWAISLDLESGVTYKYKFRNQPSFGTWDGFEDSNSIAAGGCGMGQYNDRFVVVGSSDMTLDLVKYGSCSTDAAVLSGCMDVKASDYNAEATIQAKDGNGNIMCNYASCDDIPQPGCIYEIDGVFGPYAEGFGATECQGYGGTPCSDGGNTGTGGAGCMDSKASNYDSSATSQAEDQYGNQLCVYTSCDDVPGGVGCMYSDSFGPYAEGFGATECASYGGTPCDSGNSGNVSGCMDSKASNYDSSATSQAEDQYGNQLCVYTSCDDVPGGVGCMYSDSFGPYAEGFGATECTGYGGTSCDSGNSGNVSGCMDSNASNYNADATSQAMDQYGNLLCVFTSCDQIPGYGGCIYPDSFGPYAEGFGAAECTGYGGTACSDLNLLEANEKLTTIYPNPASNFIIIADLEYTAVDVYNLTGQLILSEINNQETINISNLAEGIYTLRITDINGNLSHSKLIKK